MIRCENTIFFVVLLTTVQITVKSTSEIGTLANVVSDHPRKQQDCASLSTDFDGLTIISIFSRIQYLDICFIMKGSTILSC